MDSTQQTVTTTEDKPVSHLNWGAVMKGVAIVAGVALVAVVGAWAFGLAAHALLATHAGAYAAGALTHAGGWVAHSTGSLFHTIIQQVSGASTAFNAGAGIHSAAVTASPHLVHTLTAGAKMTGAGTALVVAAPTAAHFLPSMNDLFTHGTAHVTTTQTAVSPELAGGGERAMDGGAEAVVASSKAMKVGYHAAENHNDYHDERIRSAIIAKRVALSQASQAQSWADYVGGPRQPAAAAAPQPQASYQDRVAAEPTTPGAQEPAR